MSPVQTGERWCRSLSRWCRSETSVGLISKSSEEAVARELGMEMEEAKQPALEVHPGLSDGLTDQGGCTVGRG